MIEQYFQDLLDLLANTPIVRTSSLAFDKRSDTVGFIRGVVYVADDCELHVRELIDLRNAGVRIMYSYHYQSAQGDIIFRYDNTPHFAALPNFPHHRHEGSEQNVLSAEPCDISRVLREIEDR